MKSDRQKTLHEIGGRSLLSHSLHAAAGVHPNHLVAVVGHQREQVSPAVDEIAQQMSIEILQAVQEEQNGTGHAVQCGLETLPDFDGNRPVIGAWVVDGHAAGMGIRETDGPITDGGARFVPHVIEAPAPEESTVQRWLAEDDVRL